MNKFILISSLLILMVSNLNGQWEILNEGYKGNIYNIDFVNENNGWITGSSGTLLKTTDGGESWLSLKLDETWNLDEIDFLNDSVGWAIGNIYTSTNYFGVILRTSNGGYNWSIQMQVMDSYPISMNAIDEVNCCVHFSATGMETKPKIYTTKNGGNEWIDISPDLENRSYYIMWFVNPNVGVLIGWHYNGTENEKIISRTTNGGNIWVESKLNGFDNIMDMQFIDTTCYFTARSDTNYYLYKTENLFQSLSILKQFSQQVSSFYFLNNDIAYAILDSTNRWGGWGLPGSNNYVSNIIKSTNGGTSWEIVKSIKYLQLNKIYFSNSETGFLIESFALLKSTNGGADWKIQKLSYPIQNVYFVNNDKGIFSGSYHILHGSKGNLFSTEDGGQSVSISYGLYDMPSSLTFIDEFEGYFSSMSNGIFKTTDFGNNWDQIYKSDINLHGYYFYGNDICFIDEQNGFAAGYYSNDTTFGAVILKTTNSGKSWDINWKQPEAGAIRYILESICFSSINGWGVGSSGLIMKYTPQDGWTKLTAITDLPLNKVFCLEDHAWIAGGYLNYEGFKSILIKTSNNGDSWETIDDLNYLINDVWFMNNQRGWAVGCDTSFNENSWYYPTSSKGVILETTDGGNSWKVVVDNLIGSLNSIFVKDKYAWAVGDYGLILRTTDLGATWVNDGKDKIHPAEYRLEQNYPNPFNPTTTIKYSIPTPPSSSPLVKGRNEVGFVSLKVYDILGREVATLVNEYRPAGRYEVEFNSHSDEGQNLSSGVYFYQLKAGSYSETKKMILLH